MPLAPIFRQTKNALSTYWVCKSPLTFCFANFKHRQQRNLEWNQTTFVYSHILTAKDIKLFNVAIFGSNRGRKILQTFLTKPFLIDRYAPFTEALSSSVLLWRVLQAVCSMCLHKLKSKEVKSGDCGGQKLTFASNQLCTIFAACAGAKSC